MSNPTEVFVYVRKLAPKTRVCLSIFDAGDDRYRAMQSHETDAPCDSDWFKRKSLSAEFLGEGNAVTLEAAITLRDQRVGLLIDNDYELESVQCLYPEDPGFTLAPKVQAFWTFESSRSAEDFWSFFEKVAREAGVKHDPMTGVLFCSPNTLLEVSAKVQTNCFLDIDLSGGGTITERDAEFLALLIRFSLDFSPVEFSTSGEDDYWQVETLSEAFGLARTLCFDESLFRDAAERVGLCAPPVDLSAIRAESSPSLFI